MAILLLEVDTSHHIGLVCRLAQYSVHQDSHTAGRANLLAILLQIAMRQSAGTLRKGRCGVAVEQYVLDLLGLVCSPIGCLLRSELGPDAFTITLAIGLCIILHSLPEEFSHARDGEISLLLSSVRHTNIELLLGSRKCHIEYVNAFDSIEDHLAIILVGELRLRHHLLRALNGEAPQLGDRTSIFVWLCPDNTLTIKAQRPLAIRNDNHLSFKAFGFVNRGEFDGVFILLDIKRCLIPLLIPHLQEELNIGAFR